MDKIIDKYIKPMGILIVGSFLINLINRFVSGSISSWLYPVLLVTMLFLFGMSLNTGKFSFKYFSIGQLIILALTVLLFLYQTGVFGIKLFAYFEKYTVASATLIHVLYVYFGWLFKENR